MNIGIAVLGLGWMGQAHSRSALRIPSLFPDRKVTPSLVVCADTEADRRERAVRDFGFERATADWREAVASPDVDAVWVTAPNMLHVPMIEAACAAGKAVFSEKPIGGKPEQTVQAYRLAQAAGVATATSGRAAARSGPESRQPRNPIAATPERASVRRGSSTSTERKRQSRPAASIARSKRYCAGFPAAGQPSSAMMS